MPKKPLPQFNSLAESLAFYKQYGELIPGGRDGDRGERHLYTYNVKDGRVLHLNFYKDGRVEELKIPKTGPIYVYHSEDMEKRESDREQIAEFVKNGICECKAEGRFRWRTIGRTRVYACIKCNRPVYYTLQPPVQ